MSSLIRSILEDKFSAYLAANITDTPVHKGVTDDVRSLPLIIVSASNSKPDKDLGANPLGNYQVKMEIYVYSSADDDTLETHRTRVSKVHGLMSDVAALQNLWNYNGSEGKLYACWIEADEEGMKSRNYGNMITYTAVAVIPPAV